MPTPHKILLFVFLLGLLLVGPAATGRAAGDGDGGLTINFDKVELPVFVKFISKATGRNFVFAEKVAGYVTVVSPTPVGVDEAFAVLESALAVRGLTTVDDGVLIRIVPIKDARTAGGSVISKGPRAIGFTTRLIPLDHIGAEDIAKTLSPLVSKDGSLLPYGPSNTLIVSDLANNVARMAAIVATLDVPGHEEQVEVIALAHADASALAAELQKILWSDSDKATKDERRMRIVPDERTNSLVVVAAPADTHRIQRLVEGLDRPLAPGDERLHVYYAKHADAKELVNVLSGLVVSNRRVQTKGKSTSVAGTTAGLADEVAMTSDPATNAVIISASSQDYKTIAGLLARLDIERPQVLVEAIIAEISVNRSQEVGFEFQTGGDVGNGVALGRASLANLNAAMSNPASLGGLILAATSDRTVVLPDGTEVPAQVALFQALATDTDIEVLSAPTLLTLDNQEAEIIVGENVPFITGRGVDLSAVTNVFTTVERHDVGIKLRIKPQVGEADTVILEVHQEVSSVVPSAVLDESLVGPTTTVRSASTTVSVHNGRTAIIGGLISDAVTRRTAKVPVLGDLPFIGRLFRADSDRNSKVNLVVFLTPHIIRSAAALEASSKRIEGRFRQAAPSGQPRRDASPGRAPALEDLDEDDDAAERFPLWPADPPSGERP